MAESAPQLQSTNTNQQQFSRSQTSQEHYQDQATRPRYRSRPAAYRVNLIMPEESKPPTVEDAILRQIHHQDPKDLPQLLDKRDQQFLASVTKSASVASMKCILDRISPSFPAANQVVLESSAAHGNVPVFRYMLTRHPAPEITENLRYYAMFGGVGIWQALLQFKPECINWPIGLYGDALGLAVLRRDLGLVRFLVQSGINVRASNYMGLPVLQFAKHRGFGEEWLQLFREHGASMDSLQ